MGQVKKVPMRQCIGCRELKNKKDLIRIIKSNDGEISVDLTGKKNGRGAYICNSAKCLQQASKNKGLEKAFRMAIPKEIYDLLEKELGDTNGE